MGILKGEMVDDEFKPSLIHKLFFPKLSGNEINGQGEATFRRPSPIYHWIFKKWTPHTLVNFILIAKSSLNRTARKHIERSRQIETAAKTPIASCKVEKNPEEWSASIKEFGLKNGADLVGIVPMNQDWVFEGFHIEQRWIIMLGLKMDYDELNKLPHADGANEVLRVYAHGEETAFILANWLREQGWSASGYCGPMASPITMIPPALAAGFGELGKHGSIINRELGANFRLAYVLTDIPLTADTTDEFGADDFCTRCQVCTRECPADAIGAEKQLVRGVRKWYVDFDKCIPYFNDTLGCGICLAVCPWSRPGVAPSLTQKMLRRKERLSHIAV